MAIDTAAICGDAAHCPVKAELALRCGPNPIGGSSLVPRGTDGASLVVLDSQSIEPQLLHLFDLAPGASDVKDLEVGSPVGSVKLVVDGTGARSLFATDWSLWWAKETGDGWVREDVVRKPLENWVSVWDARMVDEVRGAAVFLPDREGTATLGLRDAGGWHFTPLPAVLRIPSDNYLATDLDASGRLWIVSIALILPTGALQVRAPDGTVSVAAPYARGASGAPIVLAGGITGASPWPAIAYGSKDGVHAVVPTSSAPAWSEAVLAGSAPVDEDGCAAVKDDTQCPATSCVQRVKQVPWEIGLARTSAGRSYVAWLETEVTTTRQLIPPPAPCFDDPNVQCERCQPAKITAWRSSTALALARLDESGKVAGTAQRFSIDTGPVALQFLEMIARGDTLAFKVMRPAATIDLLYLEIDTTQLP